MEVPHDLVVVDEFDALSIELRPPSTSTEDTAALHKAGAGRAAAEKTSARQTSSQKPPTTQGPTDDKDMIVNNTLNRAWLYKNLGKFPAKTHARKIAKELGVKSGIIYLPGQQEKLYEDSDMGPEFRQRRHFYYLSGADFPGCAVTYFIEEDRLILWVPCPEPRTVLWYGRTPTPEQCKAASEVDDVRDIRTLNRRLRHAVRPGITIYALHPDQVPDLETARATVHIDTTRLKLAIECARVIKTDYEIALIRRANAVSSDAHKTVLAHLKSARSEHTIFTLFTCHCLSLGATKQAYPIIAAAGSNGSTLHYTDNNQPLAGKQLVVLDAGAEWNCYASDVTRTFPISGTFSKEAAAIYRAVARMQAECIERVRPGFLFHSLHLHACAVAVAELLALGILHNGSAAEILARGTVAAFFPHGLGHHVGLEVHDVPGRERLLMASPLPSSTRGRAPGKREWVRPEQAAEIYKDAVNMMQAIAKGGAGQVLSGGRQKLEKNMVVTIEPGIYFCREYIEGYFLKDPVHSKYINKEVLDKYWAVGGVRIEDDILVTEDGYENLTWAPKGEEMLKVINEGISP